MLIQVKISEEEIIQHYLQLLTAKGFTVKSLNPDVDWMTESFNGLIGEIET